MRSSVSCHGGRPSGRDGLSADAAGGRPSGRGWLRRASCRPSSARSPRACRFAYRLRRLRRCLPRWAAGIRRRGRSRRCSLSAAFLRRRWSPRCASPRRIRYGDVCGAEASSSSSVIRSPIERDRLPWPCVCAFTRPGCSRRRDASMTEASSGAGHAGRADRGDDAIVARAVSAGPRKPVASSTSPPRITSGSVCVLSRFSHVTSLAPNEDLDRCRARSRRRD